MNFLSPKKKYVAQKKRASSTQIENVWNDDESVKPSKQPSNKKDFPNGKSESLHIKST